MKDEVNKLEREIADIFTELYEIELTIQSELKKHTELTARKVK